MAKNKKIIIAVIATITLCLLVAIAGCKTEKLSAPENLRLEHRTLYWDDVEDADGYVVFFDNKEYETETCFFDFSKITVFKDYDVEVMAVKDGKDNSDWAKFSFTLTEPVESGYDDKGFLYTLVDDEGYEITVGNADITGELVLPDYYDGLPVISIAEKAFLVSENIYADYFTEVYCNTVTTGVKLPSFLRYIGISAFRNLVRIEEVIFPDTVTEIGRFAFSGCKRLMRVQLPKNLKTIQKGAFRCCAIKELTLPEGLEYIGNEAFCAYGKHHYNNLKVYTEQSFEKLVLPSSLKYIGASAFKGCTRLKDVTFLCKNVEYVTATTFSDTLLDDRKPGAHFITGEKTVDGKTEKYALLWIYYDTDADTYEVYKPSDTQLYIAAGAFANLKLLKKVIIGDGITFCGGSVFSSCTNLEEVILPSNLTTIAYNTFSCDYKLSKVIIPQGVTSLGERCFLACSSLTELVIPESITSIGEYVFSGCSSLTELVIPEGVTSIGDCAFFRCSSLKSIVLPKSLTACDYAPFNECTLLESIFYAGSKDDWNKFLTSSPDFMEKLNENAKIYTYCENKPTEEGNFWHYQDDKPVIW